MRYFPAHPRLSRRAFIALSGTAVLAACTETTTSTPATSPPSTSPPVPSAPPTTTTIVAPPSSTVEPSRRLRLLAPPDSISTQALERFAAEQGAIIELETYVDPEFVLERVPRQQAGFQYDLVVMPGLFVPLLVADELLQPIDRSLVPGASGLTAEVQGLPWDPDDTYTVCKEIGFTGYAWDRTALPGGISSWEQFVADATVEPASGRVLLLREGLEVVAIPSWAQGEPEPADIDADALIADVAAQLGPHLLDLDSFPSQRMLEGGVVLAQMWSGEGRALVAADPERWGYAIGAPATGGWVESFVVPTGASDPALGHALIELMLQPDVSLAQVERRGYNTGLAAIQAQIAELPGSEYLAVGEGDFGSTVGIGASVLTADPAEVSAILTSTPAAVLGLEPPTTAPPTTEPPTTEPPTTAPPATEPAATAAPTSAPAPTTTAPQVDAKGRQVLRPQAQGDAVVTLQRRLTELGFSLGRADGVYGDVTLAAVLSFQRSQGLQPDGVVGRYTWDALENPKPIQVTGRGEATRGAPAGNSDAQAHPAAGAPTGGSGRWVKAIVYLDSFKDEFFDDQGNLVATFPNSPGVNGLTPTGTFQVYSRSADTYYSKNPAETMKWMVRFNGGIGFHSVPRISGVPEPTPLGQAPSSHGCIRHADDIAKQIYDRLVDGATVIVQHG